MKKLIFSLTALFLGSFIYAQNEKKEINKELEEVTIESFFFKQKITTSTSPISVVTEKELNNIPLQGIGDALKLEPAISTKSDGVWSTAPSIRGLSGQRVIVAVDGNRIETATDVSGGMNMINMNDISQIEIIKSGASSLYGSGAVGGVINFITQPIVYSSTPEFHTTLTSGYQSANQLKEEYLRFTWSQEKFYAFLSGSYRNAENTQTPAGELQNSQFEDYSINAKVGYRINDKQEIRIQHQDFNAKDVGVPGSNSFSAPFTVTFPEHRRSMTDVQYLLSDLSESVKLLKIKAYQQYIKRDVQVITGIPKYLGKPISIAPSGEHQLWGGLAQLDMDFDGQKVSAGIDIWQRNLESHREKFISKPDSSITTRGELPLPKASYTSNGIFARTERHFLDNKLNTTLGLRYDYIIVNNDDVYDPDYLLKDGVNVSVPSRTLTIAENTEKRHSWSANLGANYQLSKELNVAISGGHSFRAPNIEELYKYINLGSSVKIGNPDLTSEQSNFADLGIHYRKKNLSCSINGFVNKIDNMIVDEAGSAYYDNYDNDGNIIGQDTMKALILNNIEEAILYGFDASISFEVIPELFLNGNIAYTIGENRTTDSDLPQMAPMNGLLGVRYEGFSFVQGAINCEWAASQDKIATGETETDGYAIINMNLNSQEFDFNKLKIQAFAGIQNVLDTEFTNHLSSNRGSITVEPGRNFYFKVRLSL